MKARYKRAAALFLVVCLLLTSNVNSFYEYNGLNTDKTDFVSGFKFHDEPDSNIQSDKSSKLIIKKLTVKVAIMLIKKIKASFLTLLKIVAKM